MLAGIWKESEHKGDRRIAFTILTEAEHAGRVLSRPDATRTCR